MVQQTGLITQHLTRSWARRPAVIDDESELVRRGQAGDNDAFARLVSGINRASTTLRSP